MAENGREIPEHTKTTVDKELRIRNIKEKQNDERQRKLEEIKAQALAAQRFKEQKEEERRKRLDELKGKEDIRRQQVEERKKLIYQAEQDRLVSILRRNQEREARIEAKKRNERSNSVFAFGSSTPRMLDPTDMSASFWGHRRATSIQNITCSTTSSLTRRQSERDLDSGSKKRATSASGLERSGESNTPMTPAGCISGYVGRRRTDLMPTIPSRDSSFGASRKSLNHSPGRAYSMSRLDQLSKPRKRNELLPAVVESSSTYSSLNRPLSSPRQSSVTRSMSHLAVVNKTVIGSTTSNNRRLNKTDSRSMHQLLMDIPPLITPRTTRATQLRQQKLLASSNCSEASSRPSSSLSQQSSTSVTSSISVRHRPSSASRRQRPASIAITGITNDLKNSDNINNNKKSETKPPLPKSKKPISKDNKIINKTKTSPIDNTSPKNLASSPINNNNINNNNNNIINSTVIIKNNSETTKLPPNNNNNNNDKKENGVLQIIGNNNEVLKGNLIDMSTSEPEMLLTYNKNDENLTKQRNENKRTDETATDNTDIIQLNNTKQMKIVSSDLIKSELINQELNESVKIEDDNLNQTMTNEMSTSIAKTRITTEEEAKAALAERRRLAREEAERQAEQERLRIEAEAKAELERQKKEEEQVQLLIEQQRAAEQERLEEAIKETQKREEEERLRKEEEQRLKMLKEEAEKKAKEEAERQKAELQERLKNEEKEREARRKRVEAIMLRTRGKNNTNTSLQQSMEDKNEYKSENKINGTKPIDQENGTKNGKDNLVDNNIITDNSMKNTNTATIDTINSNNSWQATQTFDPLM